MGCHVRFLRIHRALARMECQYDLASAFHFIAYARRSTMSDYWLRHPYLHRGAALPASPEMALAHAIRTLQNP